MHFIMSLLPAHISAVFWLFSASRVFVDLFGWCDCVSQKQAVSKVWVSVIQLGDSEKIFIFSWFLSVSQVSNINGLNMDGNDK